MTIVENKDSAKFDGPQIIFKDKSRKEIANITSVGVLVHTGRLERGGDPNFLLVELIDEEGHPWGVPAGRSEPGETTSENVAAREVLEETGLEIDPSKLKLFLLMDKEEVLTRANTFVTRRKVVFSYQVEWSEIKELGSWRYIEGIFIFEPRKAEEREVGRLALMSANDLFQRGHPIIQKYYRWDVWHGIKEKLEGLRVI